ncbi:copper chaperone PCu(A)C [Paracoccus sp. (in: a-proteobacteria)]|uniref:copper chaperone PCu(A)C n=1 Tax=Paracoccus sp. TaxID=267 RepID=UPI00321FFBD2
MRILLVPALLAAALAAGPAFSQTAATSPDHAGHAPAAAGSVVLGDLTLAGGFSRATPPAAPVAGGFLTISNAGAADRLVSATSDIAGRTEIHEMAMQGEVMQMRQLADGLEIPAGGTVELAPGGIHLMFMELKRPLAEGETVAVTLRFEHAGEVTLPLAVGPRNARAAGKGGAHDGH